MIKRLLIVPILFSLVACMPADQQKITDLGGCKNGSCTNGGGGGTETKPTVCSGAPKFTVLSGNTFATQPATTSDTNITYTAQLSFLNSNVTFTQFCQVPNGDFASPSLTTTYSLTPDGKKLKFDTPDRKDAKIGMFTCTAELTSGIFQLSVQGNCLVVTPPNSSKQLYYVKKN